jgi:amidase
LNESGRRILHGIPLLLKDNIDTADKMTTTAGSTALRGSIPLGIPSSPFVCAPAFAGQANMSEWAG